MSKPVGASLGTKLRTYCCASRGLPWGSASSPDSGRCKAAGPGPGAGAGTSSAAAPDAVKRAVDAETGCGLETGRMSATCAGRQLQLAAALAKHSSQSQLDPWLQAELQTQADWPPAMLPIIRTQEMIARIAPKECLGPTAKRSVGSVTVWKPEVFKPAGSMAQDVPMLERKCCMFGQFTILEFITAFRGGLIVHGILFCLPI